MARTTLANVENKYPQLEKRARKITTINLPEDGTITQLNISDSFIAKFCDEIRYIEGLERWAVYHNTKGWLLDEGLVCLNEMWRDTLNELERDTPSGLSPHKSKQHQYKRQGSVRKNSVNAGFSAILSLAQRDKQIRISSDLVDNNPDLLACNSGLIDLTNGTLFAHSQNKVIVKRLPVEYDVTAKCPRWFQFLREVLVDQEVIDYAQKVFGYCLTGRTSLQQMWLLIGSGGNGKSTFLNTLQNLLGPDFGQQTPESVLMGKPVTGGSSGELMRLKGIRTAVLTETAYDQHLNETRVKALVSSDVIAARAIYSDFQQFTPEAKFFLATNHLPVVKGSDFGIWRRLVVIQFRQQCDKTADSDLGAQLNSELPGILNWALEGAQLFYAAGKKIAVPEQLTSWTSDYRKDQDVIANFLSYCTTDAATERVGATILYEQYTNWCKETAITAMTQGEFGGRLKSNGRYEHRRHGKDNRFCYKGLRLSTAEEKAKLSGRAE